MKSPRARKEKGSKRYMGSDRFAELEQSLREAAAYAKGEPNDCRVTVLAAPPTPKHRSRKDIVAIRKRLRYSQAMFARALNVSPKTIQAWEQGLRVPSDAALKLLAIAQKHPETLLDSD